MGNLRLRRSLLPIVRERIVEELQKPRLARSQIQRELFSKW
jgi:hypothetical protein